MAEQYLSRHSGQAKRDPESMCQAIKAIEMIAGCRIKFGMTILSKGV